MPTITDLTVRYGDKVVLHSFSLWTQPASVTCILGRSGCGKSTLLNAIAGTVPYTGKIEDVGKCAYVFQESRLIDNLTVLQNVEFVLRGDKKTVRNVAQEALNVMHIGSIADKYPSRISGGEASRVALARAYAYGGETLLMDEPFRALDIAIKRDIIDTLMREGLQSKNVLFVTHDVEEALMCADRIIVLAGAPVRAVLDTSVTIPYGERAVDDPTVNRIRREVIEALSFKI